MAILAQLGYGKGHKVENGFMNHIINGVVLRPQNDKPDSLIEYAENIKNTCKNIDVYFDPQFNIFSIRGDVNYGKIELYPFYPNTTVQGRNYLLSELIGYIDGSINFQKKLGVNSIISLSPIIDSFQDREMGTLSNIVELSLDKLRNNNSDSQLSRNYSSSNFIVSICISESAFNNMDTVSAALDEITSWDVEGFYITIVRDLSNNGYEPYIKENTLAYILYFLYVLSVINNYKIIIGYTNLLAIPLSVACNADFAVGWFGKTQMFTSAGFLATTGGQPAKLRYLSQKLLSSLLVDPETKIIRQKIGDQIYLSGSPFDKQLINEQWTAKESFLEDWYVLSKLTSEIQAEEKVEKRISILNSKINAAKELFSEIKSVMPELDKKSNPRYLNLWESALSEFERILSES